MAIVNRIVLVLRHSTFILSTVAAPIITWTHSVGLLARILCISCWIPVLLLYDLITQHKNIIVICWFGITLSLYLLSLPQSVAVIEPHTLASSNVLLLWGKANLKSAVAKNLQVQFTVPLSTLPQHLFIFIPRATIYRQKISRMSFYTKPANSTLKELKTGCCEHRGAFIGKISVHIRIW